MNKDVTTQSEIRIDAQEMTATGVVEKRTARAPRPSTRIWVIWRPTVETNDLIKPAVASLKSRRTAPSRYRRRRPCHEGSLILLSNMPTGLNVIPEDVALDFSNASMFFSLTGPLTSI